MLIIPRDLAELRQGDIIANIIFPLPKISEETRIVAKYKAGTGSDVEVSPIFAGPASRPKLLVEFEAVVVYAAVLSQCCDVDIKQDPPPPSFVLCRVIPPPAGVLRNLEWFETLKANADPTTAGGAFHGLFYLGEVNGDHLIADFHQTMTVDWREYKAILNKRVSQLDDVTRNKFRVRVGYHFGRPADVDIEAGLEYPWK